jgi:hypothetical protein
MDDGICENCIQRGDDLLLQYANNVPITYTNTQLLKIIEDDNNIHLSEVQERRIMDILDGRRRAFFESGER